jgi:hypothetical protein
MIHRSKPRVCCPLDIITFTRSFVMGKQRDLCKYHSRIWLLKKYIFQTVLTANKSQIIAINTSPLLATWIGLRCTSCIDMHHHSRFLHTRRSRCNDRNCRGLHRFPYCCNCPACLMDSKRTHIHRSSRSTTGGPR